MSTKISASEKFIEGQTHTLGICEDLIGGQNRIHRPYASLTPAEVFLTPAELSPAGNPRDIRWERISGLLLDLIEVNEPHNEPMLGALPK